MVGQKTEARITHVVYGSALHGVFPPLHSSTLGPNERDGMGASHHRAECTRTTSAIWEWTPALTIARLRCVRIVCTDIPWTAAISAGL